MKTLRQEVEEKLLVMTNEELDAFIEKYALDEFGPSDEEIFGMVNTWGGEG